MNGYEWDDNASGSPDRPVEMDDNGNWTTPEADIPVFRTPQPQPRPQAPVAPKQAIQVQAPVEEVQSEEDEDDDFSNVLLDARLRLEQGRLYEMLMNHNMFEGLDVDAKAIKIVERQIKKFAKEQMEIMLGMRQTVAAKPATPTTFNGLEVEALKAVAAAATQGASRTEEADAYVGFTAKSNTLKPMTAPKAVKQAIPAAKASKPLPSKAATPVKRKIGADVEQILAEEGLPVEALELDYKPLGKPIHLLTESEQAARIAESASRMAKRTSAKKAAHEGAPTPTQDMINSHAVQRASEAASNPQMQSLMALLNNQKK